jgi:hypothetical protein
MIINGEFRDGRSDQGLFLKREGHREILTNLWI